MSVCSGKNEVENECEMTRNAWGTEKEKNIRDDGKSEIGETHHAVTENYSIHNM